MEFTSSQIALITQICELSTRMGVPATTEGLSESNAPKDAVLCLKSYSCTAYITASQLFTARQTLCVIYEANKKFFKHDLYYKDKDEDDTIPSQQPPQTDFSINDITDAIALGLYASIANIHPCISSEHENRLLLRPKYHGSPESFPIEALHLVRQILEIICRKNNDFSPA